MDRFVGFKLRSALTVILSFLAKLNFHLKLVNRDRLLAHTLNVDLYTACLFVIERAVLKSPEIEIAAKFAVNAPPQCVLI